MDLVKELSSLDGNANLHTARILVLISAFSTGADANGIEGLTKLAKLDFLLRYPVMLERALIAKKRTTAGLNLGTHEFKSVESQMVRYRFGPWDHRYREFLNILIGKKLITISNEGRTVMIHLTESGAAFVELLKANEEFVDYVSRSEILKRHFNIMGTTLMKFLYDTFPEIISLRSNERISL